MGRRKWAGHKAQAAGKGFEDELAFLHQMYKAHDLATVWFNGTMAEKHNGVWIPKKSKVDYTGMITREDARFVAFDAKHIQSGYYYHAEDKAHQCQYLWDVQAGKGIGFLLVMVDDPAADRRAWAVWPQLHWQIPQAWSIKLGDDTPSDTAVPVPAWPRTPSEYMPDWLEVAIPRLIQLYK